tara:strand:- start:40 stop:249 length:210 start_codon:yes stop_codon:yes gene_type:complete
MNKVHISIKKQCTVFKVREVPFRFVVVLNQDIEKHGAVTAIRNMAKQAADINCGSVANHRNIIADMLEG